MSFIFRVIPFAAVSFFLFIVWIIIVSDSGASNIFINSIRAVPYGDKFGHICLYAVLAALVNLSLKPRQIKYLGLPLGCALVLLFALLEELSQGFFPSTRTLDIQDAIADCVGVYFVAWVNSKLVKKNPPR